MAESNAVTSWKPPARPSPQHAAQQGDIQSSPDINYRVAAAISSNSSQKNNVKGIPLLNTPCCWAPPSPSSLHIQCHFDGFLQACASFLFHPACISWVHVCTSADCVTCLSQYPIIPSIRTRLEGTAASKWGPTRQLRIRLHQPLP
jgi:hypothetical protein